MGDIETFFLRMLERVDWTRDLHFQTRTTIDTLDYSGSGFNEGSKVVIAAAGPATRKLSTTVPSSLNLSAGFSSPSLCMPGVLAISGPQFDAADQRGTVIEGFCRQLVGQDSLSEFPLILIVDDSEFSARTLNNFLWTTFTRSNPATDIHGIDSFIDQKHWGCRGSLVIDARSKPHHAPPLIEDPEISRRVDAIASAGGPLAKFL